MSPSAALLAVKQRELSAAALVMERGAKCILQYVLSVVRNVKYPSNLEKADQSIVVSATTKLNWAAGDSLVVAGFKGAGAKPSP